MAINRIDTALAGTVQKAETQRIFMPLKTQAEPLPIRNGSKVDGIVAKKAKLRKAAEGFEAIFIRQFLKAMRTTIPDGGMFGKGTVGEIYADMMDNAVADESAKRGTLGIADIMYRRLVTGIEQ